MENLKLTAQIAAAYFGSEIICAPYGGQPERKLIGKMVGLGNTLMDIKFPVWQSSHQMPISDSQLLITPLSSISDEDAIEVAKIIDKNSKFGGAVTYEFKLVEAYSYVDNAKYMQPCVQRKVNGMECGIEIISEHLLKSIEIIDYCRQNSIDVGYGSIPSLIECGIAINNEVKK